MFRGNGRDGLSYLAKQTIKYVPIGDKIELNLGRDPNVIFELVTLRASRDEIWMQVNDTNIFRQAGAGVQVEVNSSVVGWDDHEIYSRRIRKYTPRPIDVKVRRSSPGISCFAAS
ncbi:MAG: hypothetical protein ABSH20_09660 [Tepidisphaeraceae bacterium]